MYHFLTINIKFRSVEVCLFIMDTYAKLSALTCMHLLLNRCDRVAIANNIGPNSSIVIVCFFQGCGYTPQSHKSPQLNGIQTI